MWTRFLAVYHAREGLTAKEIARITLNTPRWIQETVRRYNQEGPEALKDRRHRNPGARPKLRAWVGRVWPFRDLGEMMAVVAERCRVLERDAKTLQQHTHFHWWPRTMEST